VLYVVDQEMVTNAAFSILNVFDAVSSIIQKIMIPKLQGNATK
jgi:hypothetical protein